MELDLTALTEQRQILSERQLVSLDILTMPMCDIVALINREYEENPLLDHRDVVPSRGTSFLDLDNNALLDTPAPQKTTPEEIVLSQLPPHEVVGNREWAYRAIAECMDDNGYLKQSLEEISASTGIDLRLLAHCLSTVQLLDPPGIGCRSLEECLLLQLDRKDDRDSVVRKIVQNHLHDIAYGRVSVIAQTLKISAATVRECVGVIKSLNPKPLNGLVGEADKSVVPDIILLREEDGWHAVINDGWIGGLEVCDYYANLARRTHDSELRSYLKEKAERVRFLRNAIERRRDTLVRIGEYIAAAQSGFFLRGEAPCALTMGQVAQALGLHTSTVSRAVKGKFVQYPGGVREIRTLFMQDTASSSTTNGAKSGEGVMAKIRLLIEAEDKLAPLSDSRICTLLKRDGIAISRRTVAKYRDKMAIPGMHSRQL